MKAPVLLPDLGALFEALHADDRRIIGPTVRDGAIVLAELATPDDLPAGWGVTLDGGTYRLRRRGDLLRFAHSAGPQSWKQFLHPPRDRTWTATRSATRPGNDVEFTEDPPDAPRLALLGVRPCDLRAIQVLDRVLGTGRRYATRRAAVFIVTVNCTEPGETCFCVSAGGGPGVDSGFDIGLTERPDGTFVGWAGSDAGARVLRDADPAEAPPAAVAEAGAAVRAAADRMGRFLPPLDLRALLAGHREDPRWADVAQRCLACGNCTLVCPTCFCTTTSEVTDLTGEHAQRWERWESCFDLDFSYLHGGPVRTSRDSRYRQWLSHKFGTWHDQFGESGCVGCGRCIVWCPVGIDVTAELTALAAHAATDEGGESGGTP